ncbi:hypothetical protein H2136_12430 [Aeromonas hydrophila]|uniref:Uncharacterized protein n=1 Tax=Aeromonas hydrophila TaxID=644 RepID=A0A926FHN4_AERHY|nr:hypothetical protein [Aeromonas hydrophila]
MAAFVTLNHIQTIDDKVRRAEAACRLGKRDSCNLRALRGGLTGPFRHIPCTSRQA